MCEGSSSETNVDIDALPRSVDLVRGPDGAAAFTYLDERLLPYEERFETTSDWRVIVDAIKPEVQLSIVEIVLCASINLWIILSFSA